MKLVRIISFNINCKGELTPLAVSLSGVIEKQKGKVVMQRTIRISLRSNECLILSFVCGKDVMVHDNRGSRCFNRGCWAC